MPVRPISVSSGARPNSNSPADAKPMQQRIRPGPARLRKEASKIVDLVDVQREVGEFADLAWQTLGLGLVAVSAEAVVPEAKGDRFGRPGEQGIGPEGIA